MRKDVRGHTASAQGVLVEKVAELAGRDREEFGRPVVASASASERCSPVAAPLANESARIRGLALRCAYWIGVPMVVDVSVIAITAALVKIVPVVFVPKYRMALPAAGTAVAK